MAIMSTSAIQQTAAPKTATSTWNLDPVHSVAEFKVKHMMISNVKGQFANVGGVLTLDEGDPTNSRIEASIEVASVNTRDAQRDTHLGLSATTKINRKDFGLTWNAVLEAGSVLVGDDVTITLDVQFVKA